VPRAPAGIERLSGLADMVKSGVVDMTCDELDTAVVTIIPAKSVRSRQRGNDANLMDNTNTRLADGFTRLDFRFQCNTIEHNQLTILLAMVAESGRADHESCQSYFSAIFFWLKLANG